MQAFLEPGDVEQLQRIPFNRLLTAFLQALLEARNVEQLQRIPFNRLLAAFLQALLEARSVEQLQRIPFNWLLAAVFLLARWYATAAHIAKCISSRSKTQCSYSRLLSNIAFFNRNHILFEILDNKNERRCHCQWSLTPLATD